MGEWTDIPQTLFSSYYLQRKMRAKQYENGSSLSVDVCCITCTIFPRLLWLMRSVTHTHTHTPAKCEIREVATPYFKACKRPCKHPW